MNLLDKRPLSIVITAMLCGLVFYAYADNASLSLTALISASVILLIAFTVSVIIKRKRLIFLAISMSLIFTLIFSYVYFDVWFKAYRRFEDEEVHIEGMVSEIVTNDYGDIRVTVKCDNINSEPFTGYKLLLNITKDEGKYLSVGALCEFDATLLEFERFSESFDSKGYYASEGYNALCENVRSISIKDYTDGGLEERLTLWRDLLSRRAMLLSDKDSGSFLSGLLLGEKKYMNEKIAFDFTRSGVSHILALSGMHFVILGFGIEKLLSLINVNKRWRKAFIILFAVAYTALTGASPSVLRSGIMLVISSLLYLLAGSRDTLTNMLISCAVICFITPYSVFSMSLWLSVFSTLGICAMLEFYKEKEYGNIFLRIFGAIKDSFVATFFAVGAIMWLMLLLFTGISNMMLPANLLLGTLSDLYLYIGSLTLIIGNIIPIGKLLIPLYRLIEFLVGLCASPRLGYVYTDFTSVRVQAVIFTLLYFCFLIFKVKHKRLAFSALCCLFVSIFAVSTILTAERYNTDGAFVSCTEASDNVILLSEGEVMLIDSANYSASSAYTARDSLYASKILYIDKYVITHYSSRLDVSLDTLLSGIKAGKIYLPYPECEREKTIADKLLNGVLKKHKAEAVFYKDGKEINNGKFSFTRHYGTPLGEGSITSAYTLKRGDTNILYLSSGMLDKKDEATELMKSSTSIILGCHGKKYSDLTYFDFCSNKIKEIAMYSENLVFQQDCYIFYNEAGCKIHRDGVCELDIE